MQAMELDVPIGVIDRIQNKLANSTFIDRKLPYHTWKTAQALAEQVKNFISRENLDLVITTSSVVAAALPKSANIALYTDATVAGMLGYYNSFSHIKPESANEALNVDRAGYQRANMIYVTSNWAKKSLLSEYNICPNKVRIVPRPSGLPKKTSQEVINLIYQRQIEFRSLGKANFLFVGRDWTRKRGALAMEAIAQARIKSGLDLRLTIVGGDAPFFSSVRPWIHNLGALNKNNSKDLKKLTEAYAKSYAFLLPTKAEAMGIVFSEACAYGLPIIATATGGVETKVHHNRNGYLIGEENILSSLIDAICDLTSDDQKYLTMSRNSLEIADADATWEDFARELFDDFSS
jgi:glycosyltransferase involved in cell wall biosynthesis